MSFVNPLDFQNWFVYSLAGNDWIFLFLSFLVIAILAARFKMPGGVFLSVFVVFILLFAGTFLGGTSLLEGLLIIIATGATYVIARAWNRGLGG